MKIHYDGFIYAIHPEGGINRYFKNLIEGLPEDVSATMTLPEVRERCFPANPRLQCLCPPRNVLHSGRLRNLVEPWYLRGVEKFSRPDVSHPTYHELYSRKPFSSHQVPVVLTIHDMIYERFASQIDPDGKQSSLKRTAVEAADAIICVSENTKRDLVEMLRVPEDRITVIPLASELSAEMACGVMRTPDAPYLIFVGGRPFYKNFARLLLAMREVTVAWPELRLIVVGSPLNQTEKEWIAALGLEERIILMTGVSDARLAALYRDSEALVYPSLYEGFGIPPLEAMSCGTLVIAAESSSIPEVVGDAAILFDPYSVEELSGRILNLRELGSRREEFINRGLQRATRFSWDATVSGTVKLYRQLAG